MKRTLFLAAAIAAISTSASAGGLYLKGAVGFTLGNSQDYNGTPFDTQGDIAFGGAIGKANLFGPVGLEVDVLRTSREYTGYDSRIESTSIMADLVIRQDALLGPIDGYLGAGLGVINVGYDGGTLFPAFSGNEWRFGWQAMAGAELGLGSSPAGIFAEWRYQNATDANIAGLPVEYGSHSILGGFRFSF